MASDAPSATRARSYRLHARDCIVEAINAADVDARVALLDLAFGWAKMAKQVERLKPGDLGDPLQGVEVVIVMPK
jgi:hypothetical protein